MAVEPPRIKGLEDSMLTIEEARQRFRGVIVPLATIFAQDGSVDLDSTAHNVQWIIDQGAELGNTVFLAAGSGGDFTVMSTEERMQVIKTVAEVSAGRIPIMAGVQSTDIRVTIDLCQFCEEMGVDGVQMSNAYYYDCKDSDVIAWHEEVAKHTNVAFIAYSHYYSGSKYDVPISVMDRLIDVPNTVAVKWGSPHLENFHAGVLKFNERVAVIDNSLMPVLGHVLGCTGWISHVVNFYPQHSWLVWDLMEAGRHKQAQTVYDEFMVPYFGLVDKVMAETAGEGVFVRPGLEAAGLRPGFSRLPSRDSAATPEVKEGFRNLLEDARARA